MQLPVITGCGLPRRRFLQLGAAAAAATSLAPLGALSKTPDFGTRSLTFENLHTGEKLNAPFWDNGLYVEDACCSIDHILRDFRNDQVHPIDRRLLHLLYDLQSKLETTPIYQIISGYRSPETNAMLASHSDGVAKKSLHLQGQAIDIRVPERSLDYLHKAALSLRRGGVGYYRRSNFVHVDVGRIRNWG